MPKLRHFDNTGTARFITFICHRREPSLVDDKAKRILVHFIDQTRKKYEFKLLGYVFMPEHVHLVGNVRSTGLLTYGTLAVGRGRPTAQFTTGVSTYLAVR